MTCQLPDWYNMSVFQYSVFAQAANDVTQSHPSLDETHIS